MKRTREQIELDKIKQQEQRKRDTGIKCNHPECDRMLSAAELFYSNYCFKHQIISRKQENK